MTSADRFYVAEDRGPNVPLKSDAEMDHEDAERRSALLDEALVEIVTASGNLALAGELWQRTQRIAALQAQIRQATAVLANAVEEMK
jgi:hypothetical protein